MLKRVEKVVLCILTCFCGGWSLQAGAVPGDADGNGTIDIEDARCIARFLANQIPAVPNLLDADATQDGTLDMDDAFVIARQVTGESRIVVVAPRYGRPERLEVGETIRIEVFEHFLPHNITGGTVRIHSASTGYDSGDQYLTFEPDGRSLYYHWETSGLASASDYAIEVTLSDADGLSLRKRASPKKMGQQALPPDAEVSLTDPVFELLFLAIAADAFCSAPGIPLEFRRVVPNDSARYPYLGPLGYGWVHKYDSCLEEYTDGRIVFHGPKGFNRFFMSNADGSYTSAPGDYGVLTRDPDGTFQLTERNGFIYRFRSDLRLDYEQDLNGNRITAIYDGSNHLVELHHSCGESFFLEYNADGRIIRLTDHVGRLTTYEYDETGMMLAAVTDSAGGITEYAYVDVDWVTRSLMIMPTEMLNNRLLSIAFPDDTHLHYEYDADARVVRQTGTWGANPISYSYEEDGTTHISDSLGGEMAVRVNDAGQPTLITSSDGAQAQLQYDASMILTTVTDPLDNIIQMDYDEFGNVVQGTNALGESVQLGYDLRFNKPSWITDPLGHTALFAYDSKGNFTSTAYPDSSQKTNTYDSQGNLVSI